MSISKSTITWLQGTSAPEGKPDDVRIGWRTIGVRPQRIDGIGMIMADIVDEQTYKTYLKREMLFFGDGALKCKEINDNKQLFYKMLFWIGLFLFLGTYLQQTALLYTDVANAAFFTIFYVPMVPIILFFFILSRYIGVFGHQFYFV